MYRDDKIRAVMGARRISIMQLAEMTNLTRQTVGPVIDGKANDVRLSTLKAIADALEIPMADLFEENAAQKVVA